MSVSQSVDASDLYVNFMSSFKLTLGLEKQLQNIMNGRHNLH